jgi:hypothetical protein
MMPIKISKEGPPTISVILGYGDIGIGHINNANYKGVGLVQLKGSFKRGQAVPEDQWQGDDTIKVCVLLRNKRGLAELRRAVGAIEAEMGISKRTLMDKITDGFMDEIGDKEHEIEKLAYKLKQATDRIASLYDAIAQGNDEQRAWLKQKLIEHFSDLGDS